MKLIDLLVQELPKHGGWPEELNFIAQDSGTAHHSGHVYGYEKEPTKCFDYWSDQESSNAYGKLLFISDTIASDSNICMVTREEYEKAKQPEWDGVGLPPVGIVCEREGPNGWLQCKINYVSDKIIVYKMLATGNEHGSGTSAFKFRPIRTEEERQREETIASMIESLECSHYELDKGAAEIILDAIAQGKVSGIKLAD